uniref:Uncharacterized protein n=1 Tax=Anguilla anguilla TaxID=7936 RepID=A0A0E9U367_ANGAN
MPEQILILHRLCKSAFPREGWEKCAE